MIRDEEVPMRIAETLLPEFDHEMATTRKVLARLPAEKYGWTPHPKSMTMGRLANHIAEMVSWGEAVLKTTGIDLQPQGGAKREPWAHAETGALLAAFDAAVAATRAALLAAEDADFGVMWSLRAGDQVFFTLPRAAVWRSTLLNHIIHHRGQLSVYLRLNDLPVPGIYGPSADEA
jgi:uncharacterized damage-inducible protein DinB